MSENEINSDTYRTVGVLGAGAWGTALAMVAARGGPQIRLWARESEVVEEIGREKRNSLFLPGIELPPQIEANGDLAYVAQSEAVLSVVPAQHLRQTLRLLAPHLREGTPFILCAKGVERGSGALLNEVLAEELPHCAPAILSGPSFARDVALGLPTAVTIAARPDIAARLQAMLGHGTFRPYASEDIIGVALGGAAKNVYAIGCGIVMGMQLGESARAGFLARSFAELCRLGEALGAKRETLMGLSGLGDLVLTAMSPTSRNYAFGQAFGAGAARGQLFAPGKPLAEGVETAPALVARAKRHGVELPLAETIAALLDGSLALDAALPHLMARPLTSE